MSPILDRPHRRHDPLTGRWVLVSPQRTERPWQGQEETTSTPARPTYDPDCYLCPGNDRAGGEVNPDYDGTWWFTNDYAALLPDAWEPSPNGDSPPDDGLLVSEPVSGTCRVLCFSPRHDLSLTRASAAQVRQVIDLWSDQYTELAPRWAYVQVFQNRGSAMGASNPHPHGQLWATSVLPRQIATEDARQAAHHDEHGSVLLLNTLDWHVAPGVDDGDHWQLHGHFYPPLLRSATVRKFMVGFELLAEEQRDITPEVAAAALLDVSDTVEVAAEARS